MEIYVGREVLDSLLPATMVKQDMSDKLRAIATDHGVRLADIQRAAYELFLSQYCNETKVISRRGKGKGNGRTTK